MWLLEVFDMAAIERMTITIPSEMAATVREAVAGGEYASTSEVIRDALRAWTRAHDEERRELALLRDAIRTGIESGPPIPAEEVFATLRARYAAKP
jgi:antitoxin ParD1/3/4